MADNDWDVVIGEIVAPVGLKGEVKVVPYTDFPEHFEELEEVFAGEPRKGRMLEIRKVRYHKNTVIIKFQGIDDIDAAETLRGIELRIREEDLAPLGEDEYYIHDIVGMQVITTDGEALGEVKEVVRAPANDVYVTERAMIPAVKEFVVSIDPDENRIVVRAIPGMVQE